MPGAQRYGSVKRESLDRPIGTNSPTTSSKTTFRVNHCSIRSSRTILIPPKVESIQAQQAGTNIPEQYRDPYSPKIIIPARIQHNSHKST